MYSQLEIRDTANDIAKNARKLACKASREAHSIAHDMGKHFRKVYPVVRSNLHTGMDSVYSGSDRALRKAKDLSKSARYGVQGVTSALGRDLRFVESCLIHVGLGYVIVKIYNSCNSGSAPAAEKIKKHIQEKPVESALIALGAGYLLGKIFR